MIVEKIFLKNFRNFENASMDFDKNFNIIIGDNGSGKTNIIEAIYILGNIKSFRAVNDENLVKWGEDNYYIRSENSRESVIIKNEIAYSHFPVKSKRMKIDDNLIKSSVDFYGKVLTIIFSPDDIHLIDGTPDVRRKYMDSIISKSNNDYFRVLIEFKHILKSRNALLKNIKFNNVKSDNLDIWDELFSRKAEYIIEKRKEFSEKYGIIFMENYNSISGFTDTPVFSYNSEMINRDRSNIFQDLINNRKKDIAAGLTSIGPQKDDYMLNNSLGIPFTRYASQGQKRMASISMKLSEKKMIEELRNMKFIVLIDDIYSELDSGRKINLMEHLGDKNQLFYTVADEKNIAFERIDKGLLFKIDSGQITGCNEIR
jgi:DNA replication and repair protein RecF